MPVASAAQSAPPRIMPFSPIPSGIKRPNEIATQEAIQQRLPVTVRLLKGQTFYVRALGHMHSCDLCMPNLLARGTFSSGPQTCTVTWAMHTGYHPRPSTKARPAQHSHLRLPPPWRAKTQATQRTHGERAYMPSRLACTAISTTSSSTDPTSHVALGPPTPTAPSPSPRTVRW